MDRALDFFQVVGNLFISNSLRRCDCSDNVTPTPKPKSTECKQGQTCTGYVLQQLFLQYILDKIQKFLFSIRNATICGDGECIWKATTGPWNQYGSYEEPGKIRNKRSFQWQ
jgi:hypothetical protein